MTFLLMAIFMLTVGPMDRPLQAGAAIDPDMARRYALAGPLAFGFIVSMLLALRVSFGLAATAVDVPFSPRFSWARSRGNAWPIIGALFVVYFGGAIVTAMIALLTHAVLRGVLQAEEAAAVVSWTVAILASYGVIALSATAQAVIFRRLTRLARRRRTAVRQRVVKRAFTSLVLLAGRPSAHRRSRSRPINGRSAGGIG
jgi:hypothetical protein